jgi:dihydroorotate dehydrogenase
MSLIPYALARSFLFKMDPEEAHELTIEGLARTQNTPLDLVYRQPFVAQPVTLAGLHFPNRVGLAAGLDKNARCIDGLGAMGFGFVEVGTVTPKAQPGNPKPRMFRLPEAPGLQQRRAGRFHRQRQAFQVSPARSPAGPEHRQKRRHTH